jgi:hypothetical protein
MLSHHAGAMNNLPAYLTIGIAIVVGWVAFQQFLLAREKLKLDLLEKRFAVYKGAQKFLTVILMHAKVETKDLFDFRCDTQDAAFLFGQDIVDHLDVLGRKALDLRTTQATYADLPVGEKRTSLCEKESDLLRQLGAEITKLKDVFGPYLKFKVWN